MMKKLKRLMVAFLAVVMMLVPVMDVSAAGTYPTKDMFKYVSIKGAQGATDSTLYDGINHTLVTIFLDDAIKSPDSQWASKGWIAPTEFEGENFYFNTNPAGIGFIPIANRQNMSISIVFLLRKTTDQYGANSTFLIDAGSQADGYLYYAPSADLNTYGGRAIRAYWHYFMDYLTDEGYHVDNFILGNEVNMPNQWHYSGSTNGTGDANNCATKYADAFYYMYNAVRKYTNVSRCSVSLDHSWQNDNEGRGIAAKDFLHIFHNRLAQHEANVQWCVSTHLYPAQLFDTRIWLDPHNLAPNNSSARIIDGSNLSVMTNYIRDTFGSQHRIMLTEQGFTNNYGPEAQAACLAYTYYAAKYDPMVDSFLINTENAGATLDFRIAGTLAEEVYKRIDNGNEADQQWIANTCLPIIGVSSWAQIIPNYGASWAEVPTPEEIANTKAFVERMYTVALGRAADTAGVEYWADKLLSGSADGAAISNGFIMGDEFFSKGYDNASYVNVLYKTYFSREPDTAGMEYWTGLLKDRISRKAVLAGFVNSAEFDALCTSYGITRGTLVPTVHQIPEGIYDFVERSYSYSLGRAGDEAGIEYWVQRIVENMSEPEDVAKSFFLSAEYVNKNTSNADYVKALYKTFMDRDADASGIAFWEGILQNGATREQVLEGFADSGEFTEIMASYGL